MNISELHKEIARKLQDVQSYKLWETAFSIINKFGKRTNLPNEISGSPEALGFTIQIGTETFRIWRWSVYRELCAAVYIDQEIVYKASERSGGDQALSGLQRTCCYPVEKELLFNQIDGVVLLERYVPGPWLQSFELGIFEKAIEMRELETKREADRQKEEEARKALERPLSPEEMKFAQDLGVDIGK